MAGGRWVRAGLGVAVIAALGLASYYTVIKPIQQNAESPGPADPSQEPGDDPGQSGQPMPVGNLPGWRQAFADDFDGTALGPQWDAYTGQPEGDPGGYFDPSHVSVGQGSLTIGAWPDPARGGIYVTGGISNKKVFAPTYGRYDVRYRMEPGQGIAYALLLWPKDNNAPPEIDIAEDNGRDRRTMYGLVHPAGGGPVQYQVGGDFTRWHTAGIEWTPDAVRFTLDGRVWSTVGPPAVPDEPMALALQTQSWYCGHPWEACPNAGTPPRVNLYVDWAVGYERAP